MKPGLSLRVSQHLALTPQLQQSIRLLQLSTLELSQEVGQMLDDNPFLELTADEAPREEFGLAQADTPARPDEPPAESSAPPSERSQDIRVDEPRESDDASYDDAEPSWEGDGSTDLSPDDSEWGGDAPARKNNVEQDEDFSAAELARQ